MSDGGPFLDRKLEAVVIPVSDVDRAKRFYANLAGQHEARRSSALTERDVQLDTVPTTFSTAARLGMRLSGIWWRVRR